MIKFWLKRNWLYLVVFILCIMVMLHGLLEEESFFYIVKRAIFEPGYKEGFFLVLEDQELVNTAPTLWNIILNVLGDAHFVFDVSIIFGTMWFQIIIPFFATISGIVFYLYHNTLMPMVVMRDKKKYRTVLLKTLFMNSFKLAGTVFAAYFIFMVVMFSLSEPDSMGQMAELCLRIYSAMHSM